MTVDSPAQKPTLWREFLCEVIVCIITVIKVYKSKNRKIANLTKKEKKKKFFGVAFFFVASTVRRAANAVRGRNGKSDSANDTSSTSSTSDSELDALRAVLHDTSSYDEWQRAANRLDELSGANVWRNDPTSTAFNYRLVATRLARLKELGTDDPIALVSELRSGLMRHLAGIGADALYGVALGGTKRIVEEYIGAVCGKLRALSVGRFGARLDAKAKYAFLHETRQAFGRSALMLSGGASLGLYHVGVILALRKLHLLPKVVCGSSVGAMIGAMLCCKPDAELDNLLLPGAINFDVFEDLHGPRMKTRIMRFLERGYLMDIGKLRTFLRTNLGDVTFAEAFTITGRVFNVSVLSTEHEPAFLLNYLTAPSVLVWSAACASCALPGLFEPVELMAKRDGKIEPYHPSAMQWSDGSMERDLPMERVAELFNVNHFVVSQVNPHVVPFVSESVPDGRAAADKGLFGRVRDGAKFLMWSELRHRVLQFAHLFPAQGRAISKFISQPYFGDINIVPEVSIADFEQLLKNPSYERLLHCVRQGERATFLRVAQIRDNLAIERVLDEAVFAASVELGNTGDVSGLEHQTSLDRSGALVHAMLRSASKESLVW